LLNSITPKYYIVAADALPEVFIKVTDAKRLLDTGEAATVAEAVDTVGISRSAFYKYKDSITPFFEMKSGHVVTFHIVLKDQPGALSDVLNIFAQSAVNILTINQSIPVSGCASVTIFTEISGLNYPLDLLLERTRAVDGLIKIEVLAG